MDLMERPTEQVALAVARNFEFKLPLAWLLATPVAAPSAASISESNSVTTKLRLRFSLWQNGLPADALPEEGWMELPLLTQEDLITHW
jgi:hypothetical protein